jgi:hypothetical protein
VLLNIFLVSACGQVYPGIISFTAKKIKAPPYLTFSKRRLYLSPNPKSLRHDKPEKVLSTQPLRAWHKQRRKRDSRMFYFQQI